MAIPPLPPEGQVKSLPALAVVSEPGADGAERFGVPVAELLAVDLDPPKWLIDHYLQENNIGILAGPPGAGKTLQAFDWCARLVKRGKSVFIAENEGGLSALQTRLARSCNAADMPNPPDRYTFRRNLQLSLANFKDVRAFAKRLEYHDLILLDSLSSFWPGLNENDPEHMSMVAEALKLLAEFSGAAILGIHHTTKAAWKPGEKPGLGDIRGHGSMAGRIDAAYICRPLLCPAGVVRYELHVVKQRDGAWAQPQAVEVLMTGPQAIVTMEPLSSGLRRAITPEDKRTDEIERRALAVVPSVETEALTANDIATKARQAKSDTLAAVKRLKKKMLIEETSTGRFYRLKEPNPSDSHNGMKERGPSDARRGYSYWNSVMKNGRSPDDTEDE